MEDATIEELIKQIKIANMDPEYWEIVVRVQDTPVTLAAGQSKTLSEERERGKLMALGIFLTNKDTLLDMAFDGTLFLRRTVAQLYDSGVEGFNPATFWIAKYDTASDSYAVWLTPIPPRDYFGGFTCKIKAPDSGPTSYMYTSYRYKLVKKPRYG